MDFSEDKYVWVPVEMCRFGLLEGGFHKPIRLYLALAISASGLTSFGKRVKSQVAERLNCSIRTIERYMKDLLVRNWVGRNPATATHFIRSFEVVRQQEGFYNTTAAKLFLDEVETAKRFQGFCTAAVIGDRILRKRREEERLNKNTDVHSRTLDLPPNSMQIAANYLKPIFCLSKSTCHRLKQYAKKHGYIKITENVQRLRADDATVINAKQYDLPLPGFYRKTRKNEIYEQVKADIVTHKLEFRYRRNIERQK
jgi:hypothetical protein